MDQRRGGKREREEELERVGRGDNNFNAVAMCINCMIVGGGLVFLVTFQESGVQWFHSLAALKHFVLSLSHALARLAPILVHHVMYVLNCITTYTYCTILSHVINRS